MNKEEMKARTKAFGLGVLKLVARLPNTQEARIVRGQLLRAAFSVGANYRATCRGRSRAEFIAKLGTVEEEADECAFWLEIIMEAGFLPLAGVEPFHKEAEELTAIMAASRKTAKASD